MEELSLRRLDLDFCLEEEHWKCLDLGETIDLNIIFDCNDEESSIFPTEKFQRFISTEHLRWTKDFGLLFSDQPSTADHFIAAISSIVNVIFELILSSKNFRHLFKQKIGKKYSLKSSYRNGVLI